MKKSANTLRRQQLPLSLEYFSYNRNQMLVEDSENRHVTFQSNLCPFLWLTHYVLSPFNPSYKIYTFSEQKVVQTYFLASTLASASASWMPFLIVSTKTAACLEDKHSSYYFASPNSILK